jgi:2-phosphosulfolactate phosphatase
VSDAAWPWLAQSGFEVRFGWGTQAIESLAPHVRAVVVVDIIRFTTALDVAVGRGARVFPASWPYQEGAGPEGVEVADGGGPRRLSLSPSTLVQLAPGDDVVLPSLNGSHCSMLAARYGVTVVGASLRNAPAVARWLVTTGPQIPVAVVSCGEEWPDRSLRPATEDLIGAGAVVAELSELAASLTCSPGAAAAAAAYRGASADLARTLADTESGRELHHIDLGDDLRWAAALGTSDCVPVLGPDGAYVDAASAASG